MKFLIIGGVSAGTKAASKIMREQKGAEVSLYCKSKDISYAGCGLPYYIGGEIESRDELIVNSPAKFASLTGVNVFTEQEATSVNVHDKSVIFRSLKTGEESTVSYDKLIIATGSVPALPPIDGVNLKNVFTVKTPDDAVNIRNLVRSEECSHISIVGAGFIGLEIAENLLLQNINVTVFEMADQIMPNAFDKEMADYAEKQLRKKGIAVKTSSKVLGILGDEKVTAVRTDKGEFKSDAVILSLGVRAATGFLKDTEIEMSKGFIVVDEHMKTNIDDIYAAGDCVIVKNRITNANQLSAMGSTSNISARCLAKNITGTESVYMGCIGTGVIKLANDLNAGRTGLTEKQAKEFGFDPVSAVTVSDDKPKYINNSGNFVTKLIADRNSHKLLGLQVFGEGAVDKMTDIAVVGISSNLRLEDFDTMDFSYAPPFSTAIHPFVTACYVLENKINGSLESFTPAEYARGDANDYKVIDVHPKAKIFGADFIDIAHEDELFSKYKKDEKLLLVCARGRRAYMLQNKIRKLGFTNSKTLEGGTFFNDVKVENASAKLSPADIKRVKGLGCLQDKRYPDVFNVRVITKNGKITTDEHRTIAEAADIYGSGEVTMTTRLTLEIQGVRYNNLDGLFEFLAAHGLSTGGTGSLVRPVVSCKGTTCQYGLIDTFGLSEKIHKRFYLGYHNVTLPHKFKIAVGGCPNNCVKPNLNDLGIIGQRVPVLNLEKCRGCKVCQVEKSCPIHAPALENGKIKLNDTCNNCGRCKGKCPFGAVSDYKDGYRVYIGGRWGKKIAYGKPLHKLFTSEEEVLDIIERSILFFRNEGITGERFADTVERLGFDYVEDKILNNKIDKTAILDKTVKGGATC